MAATDSIFHETLADAVLDRPRVFSIGRRRFRIWPPSLGISLMADQLMKAMGLDRGRLARDPALEALRLARLYPAVGCRLIAILTFRGQVVSCRTELVDRRAEWFADHLSVCELAQLLLLVFSEPTFESLATLCGLEADMKARAAIARLRSHEGNTRSFGGKTLYGTIIDAACRSYGWSKQYAVWGIDLLSLRMMMTDTLASVYLSDEDIRKLHIPSGDAIDANNPDNMERILSMDWT